MKIYHFTPLFVFLLLLLSGSCSGRSDNKNCDSGESILYWYSVSDERGTPVQPGHVCEVLEIEGKVISKNDEFVEIEGKIISQHEHFAYPISREGIFRIYVYDYYPWYKRTGILPVKAGQTYRFAFLNIPGWTWTSVFKISDDIGLVFWGETTAFSFDERSYIEKVAKIKRDFEIKKGEEFCRSKFAFSVNPSCSVVQKLFSVNLRCGENEINLRPGEEEQIVCFGTKYLVHLLMFEESHLVPEEENERNRCIIVDGVAPNFSFYMKRSD
jgi:hypothetical protein